MSSPRIRSIKPGMWLSADFTALDPIGRLCWVFLISQADDEGRLKTGPEHIAAVALGDRSRAEEVGAILDQMEAQGMLVRYGEPATLLLSLVNWKEHQRIDRAGTSTLPPPPSKPLGERSTNARRTLDEPTPTARRSFDEAKTLDESSANHLRPFVDHSTNAPPTFVEPATNGPRSIDVDSALIRDSFDVHSSLARAGGGDRRGRDRNEKQVSTLMAPPNPPKKRGGAVGKADNESGRALWLDGEIALAEEALTARGCRDTGTVRGLIRAALSGAPHYRGADFAAAFAEAPDEVVTKAVKAFRWATTEDPRFGTVPRVEQKRVERNVAAAEAEHEAHKAQMREPVAPAAEVEAP